MRGDRGDIPGDSPEPKKQKLLRELKERASEPLRAAALLWTFLESERRELGALTKSPQDIVAAAADLPPFLETPSSDYALLPTEPVLGAAILLARISLDCAGSTRAQAAIRATGFDDEDVIVAVRRATLAGFESDASLPDAQHAPSIATIAPHLTVSRQVHNGLKLELLRKDASHGWTYIDASLERAMSAGTLEVHLDPLGTAGLSGWRPSAEESGTRCLLRDECIDEADAVAIEAAAVNAVQAASIDRTPTILLMPELAATTLAEQAIVDELRSQFAHHRSPLLTIIGRRHRPADDPMRGLDRDLIGDSDTATHVNEAIVLGPNGRELWRHRKMTAATGLVEVPSFASSTVSTSEDDGTDEGHDGPATTRTLTEHTVPGDTVTVVATPMGWTSIVICLDTFTNFTFARLTESPIEVLFVPSLSPHVRRHRDAMQRFAQDRGAIAFVCNRSFETSSKGWRTLKNRSFWAIQRTAPANAPLPGRGKHPSFVFRLQDARKRPTTAISNDSGKLQAPRTGTVHTDKRPRAT